MRHELCVLHALALHAGHPGSFPLPFFLPVLQLALISLP